MHGETGRMFERRVLGECKASYKGYMTRREAAALVRRHQPRQVAGDAANLLAEVRRQTKSAVQFFTAVGSAMDYCHGVDAFFEFAGLIVTIDVTKNSAKDAGKADLVVCEDDLSDISALAARVVREFVGQARRAGVA